MNPLRVEERSVPAASRPIRLLHVHAGNMYGGVETFFRTLALHSGSEPRLTMDFALCFDDRIAGELRAAGATVHILGATRVRSPRSVRAARTTLRRILAAGEYDVVVCHAAWPHAIFAPVVRGSGAKLAHYMHDVPNKRGWIDRLASRTPPELVVCNSSFTQEAGQWLFPDVPRRMIRYPVLLGETPVPGERATMRASLDTGESSIVIVQASRMQEWKGHPLLIAALAELRSDPRWVCWVAGGAQRPSEIAYESKLRAEVARLGLQTRIKFLGQRNDVPALLRAADIHCQPNLGPEPFGIVFIEALAAGLPIVSTATGGPLEIVNDSCGVLVPPGDTRALAAALGELVDSDDKRITMSKAGPARARELCDAPSRTRDLAAQFMSLVSPPGPMDSRERASLSRGQSNDAIHSVVAAVLRAKHAHHDTIVDLGCGRGDCARNLQGMYERYIGCDVVRYDDLPRSPSIEFREVDLNRAPFPLAAASAEVVVAIETIEHVENPRALVREMARIVRPGGFIAVTTPNQISLMSKLYLVTKNQFHAFQTAPGLYPAHITALVPEDLRRIAEECGLADIEIRYTDEGRVPFSSWRWPATLGARGRWFSDNVILVARRP
jgi:glycosyltransferase involved in cell wall biosynthesis/2-polyprenyl-3-methyl-5-hydroxy-6-metoxy-1,4-benzoquinol methylase